MNEFVFAPSYRDLSRVCCVSIICLLVQFSFKSTTETSECKAHVANVTLTIAIILVIFQIYGNFLNRQVCHLEEIPAEWTGGVVACVKPTKEALGVKSLATSPALFAWQLIRRAV